MRVWWVTMIVAGGCKVEERTPPSSAHDEVRVESYEPLPRGFIGAVSAGHHADAYAMLCEPVRQHLSLAAFTAAVAANPYLHSATFDEFSRDTRWGAGHSSGTLRSTAGDIDIEVHVSLIGPRGPKWCITGALIGGTAMLPPPAPVEPPASGSGSDSH